MKQLSGIILAGGQSTRMGRDKGGLDYHGRSFLAHTVEKLKAVGIEDIVVSGGTASPEGTRRVPDLYPGCGPLGGIHAGLRAIRNPVALVLAVDTPLVPESLLRLLIDSHSGGITLVSSEAGPEPLIGVYDKSLHTQCEQLLRCDKFSVRCLMQRVGYRRVPFSGEACLISNCNTPEEYRQVVSLRDSRYERNRANR